MKFWSYGRGMCCFDGKREHTEWHGLTCKKEDIMKYATNYEMLDGLLNSVSQPWCGGPVISEDDSRHANEFGDDSSIAPDSVYTGFSWCSHYTQEDCGSAFVHFTSQEDISAGQ